ncbi:MAG: response regulator [Pseudomonadota bacterium]
MSETTVLLVDDDEDFTSVLSERFEARGLNVVTAGGAPEAARQAARIKFDAVILDLLMPGMDGIETLKMLMRTNPDLQVIVLTGHATVDRGIEAMKAGAMDFVEKPADIDGLMALIEEAKAKRVLLAQERMNKKEREA